MTDVATLGLAIDSRQITQATTALGQFATAAKPAAAAADDLSHAHQGMSTQAMSAFHSLRSMTEGLALGMPPMQVLTAQMNHLSYAASGPQGLTGAFKEAAGSMLGLISASTLIVGGLAAVAAGGVLALHSIVLAGKAFDDTAHMAGTTTAALHELAAAAAFKGISTDDFLKSMDKFAGSVYDAQNHMGQLGQIMRANGQTAGTFNQYLEKAADLIKNASSDQQRLQLLQQMGLPATMDWVRFLSQGADGIHRATQEAATFNASAEGQMVAKAREFDEAWAKATTNLVNNFKSAIVTVGATLSGIQVPQWLQTIGSAAGKAALHLAGPLGSAADAALSLGGSSPSFKDRYGSFSMPSNSNALQNALNGSGSKATVDPNVLAHQIALQQQAIGLLGQTASATDAVRQVELSVQAARLNGVSIDQKKVEVLKQLAYETSLGITQTKAQTDSENVNAAVVGMSVGQTAEYTAVQNALNEAKRNGRTLTLADTAAIKASASALGQATQNADNMRFAFTGLVQGPMETFVQQISQGATAMDALKAAGVSALNAISKKLADMAADKLWESALGSGASSVFNLLGLGGASGVNAAGGIIGASGPTSVGGAPLVAAGLHGGGGPGDAPTFTRTLPASMFSHAPRYHGGIGPGEKAAVIRNDESVLTPGQMRQLSPNSGGTNVQVGVSVDDNGNLQAYVKSISQQTSADATSAFAGSPQFVDHVAKASRKARTQRKI